MENEMETGIIYIKRGIPVQASKHRGSGFRV